MVDLWCVSGGMVDFKIFRNDGKISEKEYPWLKNQHLNLTEKSLITIIFSACETVFHF